MWSFKGFESSKFVQVRVLDCASYKKQSYSLRLHELEFEWVERVLCVFVLYG